MNYFPEEVLEHVFEYVESHRDRNSVAQVCKAWCRIERNSRQRVFVGNCYAVTAERTAATFPALRSLTLKGKPHFADFNLVPHDWGGILLPWIRALAAAKIPLEDLRLKRMIVSDDSLHLLSRSFPNFKSLLLVSCEGFTTDGLAAIASNCKNLRDLDLQENEIEDHRGQWLSCFPDNRTSLVSLSFACLRGEVNPAALERLVARSPDLKVLRVNRSVPLETLVRILEKAPGLTDLGTGSCVVQDHQFDQLNAALAKCTAMRSLSGFSEVAPLCLSAFHPLCSRLTSLNLSYAPGIYGSDLINMLRHCTKLRRLWVLDCVGDKGLAVVASVCKDLEELRVFPCGTGHTTVTEDGLVSISAGCPKLHSLLYFCDQMTNAALFTVAKNCPNFIRFRLCILDPEKPDPVTSQPLDEGFGAIVRACKGLKRLSLSGLLTDKVFLYIGMYAERLEMLSVAFAGDSDKGMLYVLNGCKKMRKLEIRDSPFGDAAILSDLGKYETMRSLWMSSCRLTLGACKAVAQGMPRLNVEIINDHPDFCGEDGEDYDDDHRVEKMYLYRSLAGPREDAPDFVWTL